MHPNTFGGRSGRAGLLPATETQFHRETRSQRSDAGVAVLGNDLYISTLGNGTVGVYDATTGAVKNATLIIGPGSV